MYDIEVHVDLSKLDKRLEGIINDIAVFPPKMAQELTDWQVEDMHRKYPNTSLEGNVATTGIWPRSRGLGATLQRLTFHTRRAIRRRLHHGFRAVRTAALLRKNPASYRPILRPILFAQLCDRMLKLLDEQITWKH
jgi:hypothetical protein